MLVKGTYTRRCICVTASLQAKGYGRNLSLVQSVINNLGPSSVPRSFLQAILSTSYVRLAAGLWDRTRSLEDGMPMPNG